MHTQILAHSRTQYKILETRTNKHLKEVWDEHVFVFRCVFFPSHPCCIFFPSMIIIVVCSPFERCFIDFIHLFIDSFIHSYVRSVAHSFIHFILSCFAVIVVTLPMHKSTLWLAHMHLQHGHTCTLCTMSTNMIVYTWFIYVSLSLSFTRSTFAMCSSVHCASVR